MFDLSILFLTLISYDENVPQFKFSTSTVILYKQHLGVHPTISLAQMRTVVTLFQKIPRWGWREVSPAKIIFFRNVSLFLWPCAAGAAESFGREWFAEADPLFCNEDWCRRDLVWDQLGLPRLLCFLGHDWHEFDHLVSFVRLIDSKAVLVLRALALDFVFTLTCEVPL